MSNIEGYCTQNGEPTPDNPAEIKSLDIEKDIKFIDEMIKEYNTFGDLDNTDYEDTDKIYKAIENILAEQEQDKARIKELEEALLKVKNKNVELFIHYKNSVPAQKVKDVLTEIQKEYNKVQEQFDCIWNKKSKDDYDRYKLQELSAMQQQLGFFIGKLEELLEESK